MKTTSFIILLLVFTSNLYSRENKSDTTKPALGLPERIGITSKYSFISLTAHTDSIDKIEVIPQEALSGIYEALFLGSDQASDTVINKTAIEIAWSSLNIDGIYVLVITPKQIYLRSFHYNPGINHLYWMANIDKPRFELIKNYLSKLNDGVFSKSSESKSYRESYFFNKSKQEKKRAKSGVNDFQYANFKELMRIINIPLNAGDAQIQIPNRKDFNKIPAIRILISLMELEDQIPISRKLKR